MAPITGTTSVPLLGSGLINAASQQLIKGERGLLTMSDDSVMMKQIVATHNHDGREVQVRPLLRLVEDILNRATIQVDPTVLTAQAHNEIEDKTLQANFAIMVDVLSFTIDQIFCEVRINAFYVMYVSTDRGHHTR